MRQATCGVTRDGFTSLDAPPALATLRACKDGRQRVAALGFPCIELVGGPVTAGPGDQTAAGTAARGRLRASHADREHVIDTLKAAFVQGRLTKDEFDARVGQTLASRTYADLTALTADIPTGLARAQPPRKPAPAQTRPPVNTPVKAGVRAIIAAIMMLAAPFAADGAHTLAAEAFIVGAILIFVASFVAWAWVLSSQPEKRPHGQLPGPPAPGAAGTASQRTASAAEAEQLPQINQAPRHPTEATRSHLPRPQLSSSRAPHQWRPFGRRYAISS